MIRGVTLTTTMSFVREHEEEVRRLLRGLAEAIHLFITAKEQTMAILRRDVTPILHLHNDEEVEALYNLWLGFLERKPYPTIEAITNVFALAVRCNPEIQGFNPSPFGTPITSGNWTTAVSSTSSTKRRSARSRESDKR